MSTRAAASLKSRGGLLCPLRADYSTVKFVYMDLGYTSSYGLSLASSNFSACFVQGEISVIPVSSVLVFRLYLLRLVGPRENLPIQSCSFIWVKESGDLSVILY